MNFFGRAELSQRKGLLMDSLYTEIRQHFNQHVTSQLFGAVVRPAPFLLATINFRS